MNLDVYFKDEKLEIYKFKKKKIGKMKSNQKFLILII